MLTRKGGHFYLVGWAHGLPSPNRSERLPFGRQSANVAYWRVALSSGSVTSGPVSARSQPAAGPASGSISDSRPGKRVLQFLCRVPRSPDSCVTRTENSFLKYGVKTLLAGPFSGALPTSALDTGRAILAGAVA